MKDPRPTVTISPVGADIAPHPWSHYLCGGERFGRYFDWKPAVVVAQRLAYGIALIVVPASREGVELRLEFREPKRALGEKDQTGLKTSRRQRPCG